MNMLYTGSIWLLLLVQLTRGFVQRSVHHAFPKRVRILNVGNRHHQHHVSTLYMCISDSSKNETATPSYLSPIVQANGGSTPTLEEWQRRQKSSSTGIIPTGREIAGDEKKDDDISKRIGSAEISADAVRYFKMMDAVQPNDMLLKFARTAPANVQEAAKSTVVNILGSLPNYALDAALVTTNTKLASLLYQMQITGYMFKNAEYRMSLTRALKGLPRLPSPTQVQTSNTTSIDPLAAGTQISGQVTIRTDSGDSVAVDVKELTDALSQEVDSLRAELALIKSQREDELKGNLLTYIQALPERDMVSLTSDMSDEIVASIQLLVDALMERLGMDPKGPEVVVQQGVGQLAQLCMWQMVMGYKLREVEALEKGAPLD